MPRNGGRSDKSRKSPAAKSRSKAEDKLFTQGQALLQQAENIADPDAKRIAIEAAKQYFIMDVTQHRRLGVGVAVTISVSVLLVAGFAVLWLVTHFSPMTAGIASLVIVGLAILMTTVVLTLSGFVSESGFIRLVLSIWDKTTARISNLVARSK